VEERKRRRRRRAARPRPPALKSAVTEALIPPSRGPHKVVLDPPRPKEGSIHRRETPRSKVLPKDRDDILTRGQNVWKIFSSKVRDLKIPDWYSGLHGVPSMYLRLHASSKLLTLKMRAQCLIVRMNYVLDFSQKFDFDHHAVFLGLPARRLRKLCRVFGPTFDGICYQPISAGWCNMTRYTSSNRYDWKRALGCTVGNFVHLLSYYKS